MPAECPTNHVLSAFVTGELSGPESTAISEHVKACPRCTARVGEISPITGPTAVIFHELKQPPPVPPSDPEFRAALNKLLAGPPPGPALPGIGDGLDDYKLLGVLGEGGMGIVYRAVHKRLDKVVAVKVIRRSHALDPHVVERFEREMKAAGKVRHPNLVQATDAGVANGVPYLVMEYIQGNDLARLVLRDGPLPTERACDLIRQAAIGLHHAHEHGMVHRDVKPSNLILGSDGIVRVLDLGLALLPGEEPTEKPLTANDTRTTLEDALTSPDQRLGTRHYTAPEQLLDSHRVDARADVFALGCTLVYLLTGSPHDPRYPCPDFLPPELWGKLLAPDPDKRFASATAVAEALTPYCPRPVPAPRRRWLIPAIAAVVAFAGLALGGIVWLWPKPTEVVKAPVPVHLTPPALEPAPEPRRGFPRGAIPMTTEEAQLVQLRTAERLEQPVIVKNSLGMDLVLIPRGDFAMSDLYSVTLTQPFRIGATEVTFGQYAKFCEEEKYQTAAEKPKVGARFRTWKPLREFPFPQDPVHRLSPGWGKYDDDQPIGYVTWADIDEFLKWLSKKEGRKYRLPTHAEWVWACRAGTANRFYWGEIVGGGGQENRFAWTRASGADRPKPVGKLLPNAWGLYDMFGNVEELVQDYEVADYVPAGHAVDPTGPTGTDARVTCGGSYYDMLQLKMHQTGSADRNVVYSNQGFRVVMEP